MMILVVPARRGYQAGFEELLARICEGNVGRFCQSKPHALRAPDANGTHCSSSVVLLAHFIADEENVYDPRQADDEWCSA